MSPKDLMFKAVTNFHELVFKVSGGRVANNFFGMPVVFLTTTGRKSGQPRTNPLTVPLEDGDRIVLVASKGGDPKHPAWYLNLVANPEVFVDRGKGKQRMTARPATAEEKAELWPRVTAKYKGYAQYQTRTSRDIPLVIVEPAA